MKLPLISVVIPCYNHAAYITHALDAILSQTYLNIEIIIVDDYSTDNLTEVVQPYLKKYQNIHFVKNEFGSPKKQKAFGNTTKNTDSGWAARNFGVSVAKGEYITFQDADDGSHSDRIEIQYQISQEYNSHHVVVDWRKYDDRLNCTLSGWSMERNMIIHTKDIMSLVNKTKNRIFKFPFSKLEDESIFIKLIHKIDRKFFHDWTSFPCAASMPLLKREVFEKCHFRPLYERTRPSFNGRGTDQDFNFWVAETFRDSIAVRIPLILWRVANENRFYSTMK